MASPSTPLEDRFWGKVEQRDPESCWPWLASVIGKGYGQIGSDARSGRRTMLLAHRVSYELAHGPIPETDDEGNRIVVRHRCDNPPCVNPAHLELGTILDNARDMVERGRATQGSHYRNRDRCAQGHEYTEDNTVIRLASPNRLGHRTTRRRCRECARITDRKRRNRNG